ncbi:GntR family transcriptional regulator [Jiangella alba]|uniref:Regulatory protein, gntR family n=1 Tax=Jiangella alba TaxID=561176 RepID=A0A1H5PLV8_9ACTN|nr:GntR family transcriptional regulator [Jiangella alba]SEF14746.1 regulatory protein, gntR family [Jiangella alba]
MALDPDDSRPPYIQVANALRAAILTRKYGPGEKLPSGSKLAETYGVARQTVQNALDILRDESLIVSRQGSGVFVRERTEKPVGLRPHLEQAFEADAVRVDFAGFSGETLHGAMQEPLDKIRSGRLTPQNVAIRLLVPDTTLPWTLPRRVGEPGDFAPIRERMAEITDRHVRSLAHSVHELAELGLVKKASVEVRVHGTPPPFKLYIINDAQVFFGFYPVYEHQLAIGDETTAIYDLGGKDTVLFHHALTDDDESTGSQYVEQARRWFESIWTTVGIEPAS